MERNTHLRFREEVLDKISPSFCAAKWLNATIWLNSGSTASCHHPTPHFVPISEIQANPSAIHNTEFKKEQRRKMLEGERPAECEYCWKIEDMDKNHVSDRVFKSEIYSSDSLQKIAKLDWRENVALQSLELAFDRSCNFACAYCNPFFSSTWVKDIAKAGPYLGLSTDKQAHYVSTYDSSDPYQPETNPYIEAFWKWWPKLKKELKQLRITGGEPLLSPNAWRVLEELSSDETLDINFAINSNLGLPEKAIHRLIELSQKIKHLEIYTSNEAFGPQAEYLRDGLSWNLWCRNVESLLERGNIRAFHFMMTISGLSLFSMPEFLDHILKWKNKYSLPIRFSVNILRFPSFQSVLAFPLGLRLEAKEALQTWLAQNESNELIIDFEKESLRRLIDYLTDVNSPTANAESPENLQKDLKRFLLQYDQRRNKNFAEIFPDRAVKWLESISL